MWQSWFSETSKYWSMHPRHYEEQDSRLIEEFKDLVGRSCTFVDDWSSPVITPATCRFYSKKMPAKKAARDVTPQLQSSLPPEGVRVSSAGDIQNPKNSHQEWQVASESTWVILDQKLKQPRQLLFCRGAFYEFTYNKDKKFSQSQICLLFDLPEQLTIYLSKKITVLVAPPGI